MKYKYICRMNRDTLRLLLTKMTADEIHIIMHMIVSGSNLINIMHDILSLKELKLITDENFIFEDIAGQIKLEVRIDIKEAKDIEKFLKALDDKKVDYSFDIGLKSE